MKLLLVILSLFVMPLSMTARGTNFYIDKVNDAYSVYNVNVDEETTTYGISVVTGILNNEKSFGVFFETVDPNLMVVCQIGEDIYEFEKASDGSIWAIGIKYSSDVRVILYNKMNKTSEMKLEVTSGTSEGAFTLTGEAQGSQFSKIKSMDQKYLLQTILYIALGVVITVCIILLLIFKMTHSGLFSKANRRETTFNMKEFLQNTPEEDDPYDPLKDMVIVEHVEEKVVETKPKKTAKEELLDRGYIVDYSILSEEEKEKVMLELMIMKSSQVITEEEYKKETVELWKK